MSNVNDQTPPLSILFWNTNEIKHNKNELQHLLYDKKINIALITKTHLTPKKHFNILNRSPRWYFTCRYRDLNILHVITLKKKKTDLII
jgi:hypothetical protein